MKIVISGPFKVRLSAEKEKKATHCNIRAFFLKGKGVD